MITDTLRRFGTYWLPHELFDFTPRPQLKPHLIHRITLARPRLLWKSRINWTASSADRQVYEGDAETAIVTAAAQDPSFLPQLPSPSVDYSAYTLLRMRAWQIWKPVLRLLARAFLRYIASLTQQDPYFLPVPNNEFDVPFNALTYDTVTQLLGEEPALTPPRSRGPGHKTVAARLRYIFDYRGTDQWQKNAIYLVQFRQWIDIFHAEGVLACYTDLWRMDIGYLMRPYVWIIPSCEGKTLFRLNKADAAAGVPKRLQTRWHLMGTIRDPSRRALMKISPLISSDRPFEVVQGQTERVHRLEVTAWNGWDLSTFAEPIITRLLALQNEEWPRHEHHIRKAIQAFEDPGTCWFADNINHRGREAGRWMPFWASQQDFPATEMQELRELIRDQQQRFAPDGGFESFAEETVYADEDGAVNVDNTSIVEDNE